MAARRILAMFCGATIASAGSVTASPVSDPTAGRAVFTGATAANPSSVSLSPAAMGLILYKQLYVALVSTLTQTTVDRRQIDVDSGSLAPGVKTRDTSLAPGGVIAFVWPTNERLRIGFEARLPPPQLQLEGYDDLRYHTLGIGQRSYIATVGVSLKVTNRIFVGASLSHENRFLRLRFDRDTALAAGHGAGGIDSACDGTPCGVENPLATEHYAVDVRSSYLSASNLEVTVGAMAKLATDVWFAIAYHTPPGGDITTGLDGDMTVTRAPRDGGAVLHGASTVNISYPASVDVELRARLPHALEVHLGGRWEDLSRMQSYDVRGFGSTFTPNGVPEWQLRPRGLHDSFALWGGVEQVDTGEQLRFGGRLGLETASLDDKRTSPLTISPLNFTLDLGAQLRPQRGGAWMLQLSYGLAYFPEVEVTDSAFDPRDRIACIDSGFDYATAACKASRNGYAIPSAAGTYGKLEHALRLGFRYDIQ